ncbi:DUF2569 domain-containing protein [Paenibacillus lemnae]|uniref:DUF2569 domain-containing protein n=1 Tax=Paenibacillus lemnae TaxID=1330551 RepID=A0A848M7E3_PAELE|nr:DUF2569 domain-containing protein [Paenibacillus lemnae]NMO96110.1 DUF2569 domain-containing protein [Paenibacillus lemnae]
MELTNSQQSGPVSQPPAAEKKKPKGLGGWMILVQISILLSLIISSFALNNTIIVLGSEELKLFSDETSIYYEPVLMPLIWFELLVLVSQLILLVVIIFLLYRRKRAFPKTMIGFMVLGAVAGILDHAVINQISFITEEELAHSSKVVGRTIFYSAIWIPYLLRSKRVKNTFVK